MMLRFWQTFGEKKSEKNSLIAVKIMPAEKKKEKPISNLLEM